MVALGHLKAPGLKQLALKCGIPHHGTKPEIIRRLDEAIQTRTQLSPAVRVLSIDLGVQNLAFSLVTPATQRRGRSKATGTDLRPRQTDVHAWRRLQLTKRLPTSGNGVGKNGGDLKDWSPSAMSQMCCDLVESDFLPLRPTHVLIERQRFRSGGGPAVFEWTLRVNTLENMLYATFGTLRAVQRWSGPIIPIDPKLIGKYILMDEPQGHDENLKQQKIDLLGSWLVSDRNLTLVSDEAKSTMHRYLFRWGKIRRGNGKEKLQELPAASKTKVQEAGLDTPGEELKKLDDLSDSLLQGLSWLQWQTHLEFLGAGGDPEALLTGDAKDNNAL